KGAATGGARRACLGDVRGAELQARAPPIRGSGGEGAGLPRLGARRARGGRASWGGAPARRAIQPRGSPRGPGGPGAFRGREALTARAARVGAARTASLAEQLGQRAQRPGVEAA